MTLHLGFTGTQEGMSVLQGKAVTELMRSLNERHQYITAHHGDCVGADTDFHAIVRNVFLDSEIVVHPPTNDVKRAHVSADYRVTFRDPKPYLDRNRDIVDESTCLIATPKAARPVLRSGTWSTIRYAQSLRRPIAVVYPNGAVAFDGPSWP